MTAVTVSLPPRTWGIGEPWHEIEVPIRFRNRDPKWLGYYVERADNGHTLGMVSKHDDGWTAYVLNQAFYPLGADIMETSVKHPAFTGESWATGFNLGVSGTRSAAAHEIVAWLVFRKAEALEDIVTAVRTKAGYAA